MELVSNNLLKNQVILITGANRGIGFEIAKTFAEQGGIVYANARKKNSLNHLIDSVKSEFKTNIIPVYFDITDTEGMKKAFIQIKKEQKKLDCLVNNAGVMNDALIGMISNDLIENQFAVNVFAPIQLIQLASKLMKRQKSGSIINISSIVGVEGNPGQLVYSGTKGALLSITKSAAKELAKDNIRVNAIAPGVIATDLFDEVDEKTKSDFLSNIRMNRAGTPKDVADTAVYLASDLSKYVTGQTITVDGSLMM